MWETARYDIAVVQGQTLSIGLQFKDEQGGYFDLTNYAARAQIVDGAGALFATLKVDIRYALHGDMVISLSDEDTTKLPLKPLLWDLALEHSGSGAIEKPLRGNVTVYRGATLERAQ